MTLAEALKEAIQALDSHRVGVPDLTARLLLADTLGRDPAWLIAHSAELIEPERYTAFQALVRERCEGVPTQYLRGIQEFYSLEFAVSPDVLIPRPETEHLVEAALERIRPGDRILDLGTGSGAVAVAVAKHAQAVSVVASDISAPAARIARNNAGRLDSQVQVCVADLGNAFRDACFDAVLSNPPYVPAKNAAGLQRELRHEPQVALYGGQDGLRVIARLLEGVPRVLKPGGWLMIEIGFDSRPALERMLDRPEWDEPAFIADLAGIDRVAVTRRRET